MRGLVILFVLLCASIGAVAQNADDPRFQDNSFIIDFIENQLSTDTRKIRLSGVSGLLASRANVRRITISDRDGVWLQIDNALIDWNRAALFDKALVVNSLSAERIIIRRSPVAAGSLPNAQARSFKVPDLPVSVTLRQLKINQVELGEPLFGMAAIMAVTGNLQIGAGKMSAALGLRRLDANGGEFTLKTAFDNRTEILALDLALREPREGIAATLASIHGLPAMDLQLSGKGPLSDLSLDLLFRADDVPLINGTLRMSGPQTDRSLEAELTGNLEPLVAAPFKPFFNGISQLRAGGRRKPDGGLALDKLELSTGVANLTGWLVTTADGFLSDFILTGAIASDDGQPVTLPLPGGETTLQQAEVDLHFGGGETWGGFINVNGLVVNDLTIGAADIVLDGTARNIEDSAKRALSGRITAQLSGLSAITPELAQAFGTKLELVSQFSWQAGNPLSIERLLLSGNGVSVSAQGNIADFVYSGNLSAKVADLRPFSGISERDLSGSLRFVSTGSVAPISGAFDLMLEASATDMQLGSARFDPLFAGGTKLQGRLLRGENGSEADDFRVFNDQVDLVLDGKIGTDVTNLTLTATLQDLGQVSANSSGEIALKVQMRGQEQALRLVSEITMPDGLVEGHSFRNGRLAFGGMLTHGTDFEGQIVGSGALDGAEMHLTGEISGNDRIKQLRNFSFVLGQTVLRGTVGRGGDGLLAGTIDIAARDISQVAALLLTRAEGAVNATLMLSRSAGQQRARLNGVLRDFVTGDIKADRADIDLDILDVFHIPLATGTASGTGLQWGDVALKWFDFQATRDGTHMDVKAEAILVNDTRIDLAGGLSNLAPGFRVNLRDLRLQGGDLSASLVRPAEVEVIAGETTIRGLELDFGTGAFSADGRLGSVHDLRFSMRSLPLRVANLISPDLSLGGTVNGTGRVTGAKLDPNIVFDISAKDVAYDALARAGLSTVDFDATGKTQAGRVDISAKLSAGGGLAASLLGSFPTNMEGDLDLDLGLAAFPLPILNVAAGGPGLVGTVNGGARITGQFSNPHASFELRGTGISARLLQENGFGAFEVSALGTVRNNIVQLTSAQVNGQTGVSLKAQGRVPLRGAGLNIAVEGTAPMRIANVALARASIQMEGALDMSARVEGHLNAPQLTGAAHLRNGSLVDLRRNIRIDALEIDAALSGTKVIFQSANGRFASGGKINADGNIDFTGLLPADLRFHLDNAQYSDGIALDTSLSGDITLRGPLRGPALISGTIDLGKTEIAITDQFAIQEGVLLDVKHRGVPRDVNLTLKRAGLLKVEPPSRRTGPFRLDVTINAPNQIFMRGRGLDVEMGGSVRVHGAVGTLVPVGRFEMRRGRLSILGQRIPFDNGWIALTGSFDPEVRLEAEIITPTTLVILSVDGSITNPRIHLSSSPSLPQDEILSQLIFQRELSELTPFQLAQVGAAATELAGNGPGLVGRLRTRVGLDDLDFTASDDGAFGVRAGAYLRDNIYLDVTADSKGTTRATVNLDITDDVRARASFGTDGESNLGIFYERDY